LLRNGQSKLAPWPVFRLQWSRLPFIVAILTGREISSIRLIEIRIALSMQPTRWVFKYRKSFRTCPMGFAYMLPADLSIVRELSGRDELELVFIDADHQHPRPLLDVLRIAPHIQCGGWILLHDITLGGMGVAAKKRGEAPRYRPWFGAEWLFAEWPFRKISSANIGAIQMASEKTAIIPMALRLIEINDTISLRP
jgi:Methyltransferase domain